QAFTEAAEAWLLRARNPQADAAFLEAVQRRQAHYDVSCTASIPPEHGTPMGLSAAVGRAARLMKLQGQQHTTTWLLPPDRPVWVGRSGASMSPLDIDLWPDASVSRRHAILWFNGEGWCIEDLHSKNGTWLGEHNIQGQPAIRFDVGTRLQIGRTVLL